MTHRSLRMLLTVCSLLALPFVLRSSAQAQDHDPNRSGRTFFARGALGAGWVGLESDPNKKDLSIGHVGMYWDLAAGATVWRNLALHGTYFGGWAWEPDVESGGTKVAGQHGSHKSLSIMGVGPGATYHFLPINLYLSYSVGFGWSVLRFHENKVGEVPGWSNFGFANEVVIGKEWWIGNGLAIGAAVQALYAHVKDDDDEPYNSFGGSLMFSATYH